MAIMLNVDILSVIMLNVVMLSFVGLSLTKKCYPNYNYEGKHSGLFWMTVSDKYVTSVFP
jgi:hypothetical protein